MSLYSEYLDAKSEVLRKDLAFKSKVSDWFAEHNLMLLPINVEESLTMDHITITTDGKFKQYINEFEEEFSLKNVRIHHTEIIIPDSNECKEVWKFHFKER